MSGDETEMGQVLVTEEEAAEQVEAQLAAARAAWENEQHQLEVERQHAEQVEQLTSQLAIIEAEAKHTRAVARLSASRLRQEAVAAVKLTLAESMLVDCERQLLETQAAMQV